MTERTIVITLTETQCNELANLLDLAVKAGGIVTARLAVKFIERIEAGLQAPTAPANVMSVCDSNKS